MTNILAHNQPPTDVDPLAERLPEQYRHLHERTSKLVEAEARLPDSLTDETVGKVSDFARQIKAVIRAAEDAHRTEKADYLEKGRICDRWLGSIKAPLGDLAARVEARVTAYMRAKEAEERQRRQEEARRLAAEAKALAAAGDKGQAKEVRAEAKDLREEARNASAADLTRISTGMGGVVTARSPIEFEIKDKQAAAAALWQLIDFDAIQKAAREYKRRHKDELRGMIEAKNQPVPGVRFFIDTKAMIR